MTEKYTINSAAVAVRLGALQSSNMPIKELNGPVTLLGERDLPPNPACHLTSGSREASGRGSGNGCISSEEPRVEGGRPEGLTERGLL